MNFSVQVKFLVAKEAEFFICHCICHNISICHCICHNISKRAAVNGSEMNERRKEATLHADQTFCNQQIKKPRLVL